MLRRRLAYPMLQTTAVFGPWASMLTVNSTSSWLGQTTLFDVAMMLSWLLLLLKVTLRLVPTCPIAMTRLLRPRGLDGLGRRPGKPLLIL